MSRLLRLGEDYPLHRRKVELPVVCAGVPQAIFITIPAPSVAGKRFYG
jgi:hypothetical protein